MLTHRATDMMNQLSW